VEWRVTMKTFLCDIVEDWATVLVYRDGTVKCTHFMRHGPVKLKNKKSKEEVKLCRGPENCDLCLAYKEDVFRREKEPSHSGRDEGA